MKFYSPLRGGSTPSPGDVYSKVGKMHGLGWRIHCHALYIIQRRRNVGEIRSFVFHRSCAISESQPFNVRMER